MDAHEAIFLRALRAVIQPDDEAYLRHVHRYFSKNFHVPLDRVEELDEEFVFVHYWESVLSEMEEKDRQELLEQALETPEERQVREGSEKRLEKSDEAFLDNLNREVKSGAARPKLSRRAAAEVQQPANAGSTSPDIHATFDAPATDNLLGVPDEWLDGDSPTRPARK